MHILATVLLSPISQLTKGIFFKLVGFFDELTYVIRMLVRGILITINCL